MTGSSVAGHFFAVPVDFRIALARIRFSYHVLVQLHADDVTGIGEGVLYRAFPDQAAQLFRHIVQPAAKGDDLLSSSAAEQAAWLAQLAAVSPALSYAVDTALWDLRAKKAGKALVDLLGRKRRRRVPITEQVFIRDWPTAEEELDGILSRGTRQIKVKIGTSPQADLEALRRVRALVGPEVEIRVDANHAYTLAEGEQLYRSLADLGVLALEEPLPVRQWPALRELRGRLGLAVILDESILTLDDLQMAIAEEAVDILNIKLTRVGGISQALQYAGVCYQHGVQVAIGCSEELGVGTAAIVHLASALPEVHSVEGLGPQRLGFDLVAEQWGLEDGMLACPEAPGLGVTLPTAWVNQLPPGIRCFNLSEGGGRLRIFSRYARWFQRASNLLWRVQRRRNR